MIQLKDGTTVHVYSGSDAAPGTYIGSYGIHPNSGVVSSATIVAAMQQIERTVRRHNTVAEVNAGVTLLAASAGIKYRASDAKAIAVGGAAGAVTTVDILATQAAASVKLFAFAQASLTQSAVLRPGVAGTAVLADGASFAVNDENTIIQVNKTGANVTTSTFIDTILDYSIEIV